MKIATPGDTQEWMRSVNKRLALAERRGGPVAGTTVESVVVDDEVVITYAPVVPSQPITEQRANSVAVIWDGLGAGDEAMPPNFATLAIHRSQEGPDFEPDEYTRVQNMNGPGTIVFTDQPYDEVFYYRFVMHTTDGQASGPSASAVGIAVRVGGNDLTADSIDGKLITGATIQTGTTGGRAVLRPGTSTSYGLGSHVVELHTGNALEAYPAELLSIADGPGSADNISLLIAGPEKTGFFGARSVLQLFAKDADSPGNAVLFAETAQMVGSSQAVLRSGGVTPAAITAQVNLHGAGLNGLWSNQGIECWNGGSSGWTTVPSSTYTANGWSDYPSGDPYSPGVRWRYTHDSHIEVQMALRTTTTAAANPFVLNTGHGMPMPADRFAEGWLRYLIATGYNIAPVIGYPSGGGNTNRWQLLQPAAATYTVLAGMFTYRWRYE